MYQNRILGDATSEFGPFYYFSDKNGSLRQHNSWYDDFSLPVDTTNSWYFRGGNYQGGFLAGQGYFLGGSGNAINDLGYRIVLTK